MVTFRDPAPGAGEIAEGKPAAHLVWDPHPFMEWLDFELMVAVSRQQAPVLHLSGVLEQGESLFLMQRKMAPKQIYVTTVTLFALQFRH
jgi:hypothetical protein